MEPALWAKAHGAITHFPLALAVCSGALDLAGFVLSGRPIVRELHATSFWMLQLGTLGSVPAVLTGLLMTKGSLLGHGALRIHHLFVWPSFALLVALATWRIATRGRTTRRMFAGYLIIAGTMVGLLSAAGYWGGEMMVAR